MTSTITTAERRRVRRAAGLLAAAAGALAGCAAPAAVDPPAAVDSWSVTAWGSRFEVFPEVEPLVAGAVAVSHTHVTRLAGFSPLVDGQIEIVLSGPAGEEVFSADRPQRPGIFAVEIAPRREGDFDLSFRIRDAGGAEEIRGGRVRVGSAEQPGGPRVAPAPRGASDGGEALAFLKEEQWRSDFATEWVRSGRLAGSVAGLAVVRPPAGGEATVTAPVDGILHPAAGFRSWPFAGLRVERGGVLFRISPRVAADRSLATLEAEASTLAAERGAARARLGRLRELLALDAASRREVEVAEVRVETLAARRDAAVRDLESARSAREGGPAGADSLTLRSPFAGEVAEVAVSPGVAVAAGDPLARLVRTDAIWLEVSVPPAGARRLAAEGVRGVVLGDPELSPVRIEEGLRRVSIAPELSPRTGTVSILLEAPADAGLTLGTILEARVLSREEREGVVIPASAVVDDGGVAVVYLQLSGESFVRQEIRVLERQGDLLRVERLIPGQRLVSRGGDAIRRAALLSTGSAHGHVH